MTTTQIMDLVNTADPLGLLAGHLTGQIWTPEAFDAALKADALDAYMSQAEHEASQFEREVYDIYPDVYHELEDARHPLKSRIEGEVLSREEFTLVVFDALSLRELPPVQAVLEDAGLSFEVSHALACVPSETTVFSRQHFGAPGPANIKPTLETGGFAYEYARNTDWQPEFMSHERRRVIWCLYPDNVFRLNSAAVSYRDHIVQPVQTILKTIVDGEPVMPLFITSDHGYLWQGGSTAWPLDAAEAKVMSDAFKQGRSTSHATQALETWTDKAWLSGLDAAARGRFGWGSKVRGAGSLFVHGGVSLMECLTPWAVALPPLEV